MLQWLMLLMLFVHNSLAFRLYDEIDECKKDILILWDNSASVGINNFKDKVLPFLKKLVTNAKLNVGKEGTHLGFTTFSTEDKTKALLKVGEKTEADELESWLDTLDYKNDLMGDQTYTGKAFKLASTDTFKSASPLNHRAGVDDIVMLFTDGEPNPSKGRKNQIPVADTFSTELKSKNVKIIGLAVGKEEVLKDFYSYIVDWSSPPEKDYVFKADLTELNDVVNKLVGPLCGLPAVVCRCTKPVTPFTAYAEPGQQTGKVSWPKQEAACTKSVVPTPGPVDPPGAISGGRYPLGKHGITYPFSYNDAGKPKVLNCQVNFTVVPCECPSTQTVNAKVKPGDTTVVVSWQEPEPNCPTKPSPDNPKTSESLSVGTYTRTYKYTYSIPEIRSFDIECHVNIVVTGELCGETVYDPAKEDCCCGKIETKKYGYQCCGMKYYNTRTKKCCNNERAILVPIGGNCP